MHNTPPPPLLQEIDWARLVPSTQVQDKGLVLEHEYKHWHLDKKIASTTAYSCMVKFICLYLFHMTSDSHQAYMYSDAILVPQISKEAIFMGVDQYLTRARSNKAIMDQHVYIQ